MNRTSTQSARMIAVADCDPSPTANDRVRRVEPSSSQWSNTYPWLGWMTTLTGVPPKNPVPALQLPLGPLMAPAPAGTTASDSW